MLRSWHADCAASPEMRMEMFWVKNVIFFCRSYFILRSNMDELTYDLFRRRLVITHVLMLTVRNLISPSLSVKPINMTWYDGICLTFSWLVHHFSPDSSSSTRVSAFSHPDSPDKGYFGSNYTENLNVKCESALKLYILLNHDSQADSLSWWLGFSHIATKAIAEEVEKYILDMAEEDGQEFWGSNECETAAAGGGREISLPLLCHQQMFWCMKEWKNNKLWFPADEPAADPMVP